MSATELATVVEGWATLAGLMVVIAGALFAGVQLRRDAKARRDQTVIEVLSAVHGPEVPAAIARVLQLPDGFIPSDLTAEDNETWLSVLSIYNRIGHLLMLGMVEERDIFSFPPLSVRAIQVWEKLKHLPRRDVHSWFHDPIEGMRAIYPGLLLEMLAARAQAYLEREGARTFGSMPIFDADPAVLQAVGTQVAEARGAAHS